MRSEESVPDLNKISVAESNKELLKALKPQPGKKPSQEQMTKLRDFMLSQSVNSMRSSSSINKSNIASRN